MQHIVEGPQFAILVQNVEAWALCAYLMAENGPDAEFWIADGLGDARGWSQRFVPRARRALLEMGIIQCVRPRGNGVPALYRWAAPQIEAEQTSRNRQVSPSKQTSRIR